MMNREHYGIALAERDHHRPRLHARTLLGDDEFAAGEVPRGFRQQDGRLQREDMLAVEILVQAVIVIGAVLQQQRRRPALACRVAAPDEGGVLGRKPDVNAHRVVPAIGDDGETRVQRCAQLGDEIG
ncbi:hypothetical protein D3C83_08070 [compost metagenome]